MIQQSSCFPYEQTNTGTTYTDLSELCRKQTDSSNLQDKLTGALIGLVRSIDGNEDLITEETNQLILEGLFTTITNATFSDDTILPIIDKIKKEKQRLVPNCFYCTASCGRTDDYNMEELWNAKEEIRILKSNILFGIRGIATYAYHAMVLGYKDETVYRFFYRALFAIGMDWGKEELLPIVLEVKEFFHYMQKNFHF